MGQIKEIQQKLSPYERIVSEVRFQIIAGILEGNYELPSVRSFAEKLHVSCATVHRAYKLLKAMDYIYSIPGKGYYVTPNKAIEFAPEEAENITKCICELRRIASQHNLDIISVFRLLDASEVE